MKRTQELFTTMSGLVAGKKKVAFSAPSAETNITSGLHKSEHKLHAISALHTHHSNQVSMTKKRGKSALDITTHRVK